MLTRAGTTCRYTFLYPDLAECTVWNIKASVTKRFHSFRLDYKPCAFSRCLPRKKSLDAFD
jgi:hypothetical protein